MRRLMSFTLAAVAAAVAGLVAKRLLTPGTARAPLPSATDSVAVTPEQPARVEESVSLSAVSSASRSLPGTREQLYKQATKLGVRGRSRMNKKQLQEAVETRRSGGDS
jgi:hypothetical protein